MAQFGFGLDFPSFGEHSPSTWNSPLPSRFIEVRAAGEAPFLCEEAPGQPRGDWLFPQVTLSAKLGSGPRTVQIRAGSKLQDGGGLKKRRTT